MTTSPTGPDPTPAADGTGARVAVVDVRRTVADAVTRLLAEQEWVLRATAHTRIGSLAALLAEEPVDVVVVEARVRPEAAAAVAAVAGRTARRPRLLVIGASVDPEEAVAAVADGATAWLPSDSTFEELTVSLRQVLRGAFWVPGRLLLDTVAELTSGERESTLDRLTPRELDVLQGMVDGLTRPQIADRLGVSPHTVRTHVHGVLHKLSVHSSLRAVAVARDAGLVARGFPQQRSP